MSEKIQKLISFIKRFLFPIHKEGFIMIAIFAVVTAVLSIIWSVLGIIGLIATTWCVYFFRDPARITPKGDKLVISPADGLLEKIEEGVELPEEIRPEGDTVKYTRISIFLNIFNVHVNRVPFSGKITKLHYRHGKFISATSDKSSTDNEAQMCLLETKDKKNIGFVQIAGMIARRIVCDLKDSQAVKTGDKYGIIKFGSRVDLYVPKGTKISVLEGQTMIGGETVIAEI